MLAFGLSLLPLITASKTKSITGSHHAPTEYFYQNVKLTKEQYEDSSILLKLEHESKHPELIHSHDHQVTFDDLLEEIQHVKKAHHGKLLSPDVIHKLTREEKKANGHLRSLMKQNNFIELAVYNDLECQNTARTVGRLVNYCYNQYYSSFAFKVNKKENVIAQLEYDGLDCRGVPTKVSNLQAITHVSQDFGECVNGIRWNYLSDYPVMQDLGAGYGATYSNIDVCDPTVKNYYGYDFRRGDFCSKVARQNNVYAKSNVQGCEGEEGLITLDYFFDSACSGSVANSELHEKEICQYPSYWDGDDQDDFKQDGSNYVKGEVHTDYCYDPTHSSTPPAPVTGTCTGSFFYWVGDGFCDSSKNNAGCNYDGGDCCVETCVSTQYSCGTVAYHCIDPNVV